MNNEINPLEELENEIVEYIINTPQNTNPNVARTMVRAAGEKVSAGGSKPVYFIPEMEKNYPNFVITKATNLKTGEESNLQEIVEAGLSGSGYFITEIKDPDWTDRIVYYPL